MKPLSIRARLTLWHTGVLASIVVVFALGVFLYVRASVEGQLNLQLAKDLAGIEGTYSSDPGELKEFEEHGLVLFFTVTESGKVVHRTELWKRNDLDRSLEGLQVDRTATAPDGHPFRVRSTQGSGKNGAYQVAVAVDEAPARQTVRDLAFILLLGVPAALALALVGGSWLAGRILTPIRDMATQAERISAERLSERLPAPNPHDEFGRLATVFNDALGRLHNSFEQLRRFTSDASHELRTPLTAIRSVGEVALQDKLDAAGYRDVVGSMLEEVDRLSRLVDSLLALTRAESGRVNLKKEKVDLGALAKSVGDYLRVLSEEKEQTLSIDGKEAVVLGDADILRQAVINLLDNAIKYTPEKGSINVFTRRTDCEAILEVSDTGPGIAEPHREKIFERFYRIDEGRDRDSGGVGLGLALTRWAVNVNGGRIELESVKTQGSLFRIVLPLDGKGSEAPKA
jgi:heavy metal sensor kinase